MFSGGLDHTLTFNSAILTLPMDFLHKHSIKIIIIFFSIAILLGFGSYLLWTIEDRKNEFYTSHKVLAQHTTQTIADEIERVFRQKNILVNSFVEDNRQLLNDLAMSPGNRDLYEKLNHKLSKYFLDYFSTSLASDEGKLLIDDFDGVIGELCVNDMKHFVETGEHLARIHPHPKVYHYDMVVKLSIAGKDYLFMVSFAPDEIATLLKLESSGNHQLILVQKEPSNIIELTPQGTRINMHGRLDFRMTQQELDRVLAERWVTGTRWHVYDLHAEKLFTNYSQDINNRSLWIYVFVVMLVVVYAILLLVQVCKTKKIADDLVKKNKEIEALNAGLKDRNIKLSEQAITDGLTGLYNRRYFDIQVSEEYNRAQRLWLSINIAFIDIDYFKQYNDLYGHQMGDVCLKVVADLISKNFKRSNEFVARYGGEEFVVVNIGTKPEFFKLCMQEVRSALSERKIAHDGSDIDRYLTMSIGIASAIDARKSSHEELIALADAALYDAKKQGRNRVMHRTVD